MTSLHKLRDKLAAEERKQRELVLELQQLKQTIQEHQQQFGTSPEYALNKAKEIHDSISWCYVRVLRLRADFAEAAIKARRFMDTEIPDQLPDTF